MDPTSLSARLLAARCTPKGAETPVLEGETLAAYLTAVPDWNLEAGEITRTFTFGNFLETIAFVNALAWVAHAEDHHPHVEFGYKQCHVRYHTHSIGGLSENDFICALKINQLQP